MRKRRILLTILILTLILIYTRLVSHAKPEVWHSYTVQPGDTLYSISVEITPNDRDYRETVGYIMDENDLSSCDIKAYDEILVPMF